MARRKHHEDHVNHEAWAIPYGDLVTLLLAFFVVMYAMSSVNAGKYRVLAASLSAAFGGLPTSIKPIQLGQTQLRGSSFDRPSMQTPGSQAGPAAATPIQAPRMLQVIDTPTFKQARMIPTNADPDGAPAGSAGDAGQERQLLLIGKRIQQALSELVKQKLVTVRRGNTYLEVEIQSDILFASGVATPSPLAVDTIRKLAQVLRDQPNAVRVEGYTDNKPIHTFRFPSNWELSAARAGSVVHELVGAGLAPQRLAVVGYGEYQPIADNATAEGRNANRRVLLVILAAPSGPDAVVEPSATVATLTAPDPPTAVAGKDPLAGTDTSRGGQPAGNQAPARGTLPMAAQTAVATRRGAP